MSRRQDLFPLWYDALERRHLAALEFAEVRRALQALSSLYVERRGALRTGAALQGAGKRAAFALFYAPLHFLVVRHVVQELAAHAPSPAQVLDLGCGTGVAGAAWVLAAEGNPPASGIDLNPWAVAEARWNWASLGVRGTARTGRIEQARLGARGAAVVLGWAANELTSEQRDALLPNLLEHARRRGPVLVVEPISRRAVPWWDDWAAAFAETGGRADAWRFPAELPERLRLLDRAAGLDHRELTARSLYAAP